MPHSRNISTPARLASTARAYASAAGEALAETLWPTRCAVCDEPGEVLCDRCRLMLPHIDLWRACPRCGAPFGRVQCCECNDVMLTAAQRDTPPFDTCVCALSFDEDTARVVRTWKDAGERRLVADMADLMTAMVPPDWLQASPCVVFVPASRAAVRRRGFDHGQMLGHAVADRLSLPCTSILARPRSIDQRTLGRKGRLNNTAGRFTALPGASIPADVLLTDDVYTTGATLFAACDALRAGGATRIRCLTFARV